VAFPGSTPVRQCVLSRVGDVVHGDRVGPWRPAASAGRDVVMK